MSRRPLVASSLPLLVALLPLLPLLAGCERRGSEARAADTPAGAVRETTTATTLDTPAGRRPEDVTAVVRSYLDALRRRDYASAASLWADGATAGAGDSAAFRRAHGDTSVAGFVVGSPGRIGAAAGSRYVEVPVTMEGTAPDRPPLRLHGIVTLRRSVVDGASEAQRRWRIARLEWSTSGKPASPP